MASGPGRRKRLKQEGLCSQCTSLPVPGRSRCQKHLDKANALARRRNADRKRYGLCIRCPEKATEGHVLCQGCLDSLRTRDIDWTGKRDKERTKQQIRMDSGLCKWCEKPREAGRALCTEHLQAERDKVRIYRADRKARGLCWRCGNPARPGGSLCQEHRDEVTEKERGKIPLVPLVEGLQNQFVSITSALLEAKVGDFATPPLVAGAGSSSPSEVVPQIDPTPIPSRDGSGLSEVGSAEPMMPVKDDGLGVDVASIAHVVEGDGVKCLAC